MAQKNTADVGFEKQIWNAADVLRGSMDASEYKHVVLGLIFLKYIIYMSGDYSSVNIKKLSHLGLCQPNSILFNRNA